MSENNLKKQLSFGFEQTFTIESWWTDPGFTATSDTPLKREKMLHLADHLAEELKGKYFESKDIWDHMQYEVTDSTGKTQFYVTMDPGSIEVKTPPVLCEDTEKMAEPLFIAAENAGLVAYRSWWYGVKGGTEGGCHVNMGGFSHDTNPLYKEPDLVVKYAAYIHNRPWLHFPFMGLDVGPGGNAMRMDEKENYDQVKKKFDEYKLDTKKPSEIHPYFSETNLISDKASFPSLYKFKEGLYLIEDRGQESLREAEDFYLVSVLRLKILESLQSQDQLEELKNFPHLHSELLTSFALWREFQNWSNQIGLSTEKYRRFFERQFPKLEWGQNIPSQIFLRDGRRPRVIKDIQKRGETIISKTIDTTYKRFEIYTDQQVDAIEVETPGVEVISPLKTEGDQSYVYIDLKYDQNNPLMYIKISKGAEVLESATFNINDMMWT
ncbi:MAG: hypothetical protein CME65_10670 [Halobacteriovoraceae bacterium]|nr:hypothetical protein [Halobacteriovoraceae bacterium]